MDMEMGGMEAMPEKVVTGMEVTEGMEVKKEEMEEMEEMVVGMEMAGMQDLEDTVVKVAKGEQMEGITVITAGMDRIFSADSIIIL
ncbi:hypothetical protein OIP52_005152 [Salmonella enterica]|nr:hypothetical protein [Salmonella enterica]